MYEIEIALSHLNVFMHTIDLVCPLTKIKVRVKFEDNENIKKSYYKKKQYEIFILKRNLKVRKQVQTL